MQWVVEQLPGFKTDHCQPAGELNAKNIPHKFYSVTTTIAERQKENAHDYIGYTPKRKTGKNISGKVNVSKAIV